MHWMLGSAVTVGLGALPVRALAGTRVAIPDGPMVLSRTLERSLSDGASIAVSRSWQVEFESQGRAVAINGMQVHVEVAAPDNLARLAEIEKARSTADMWPILLSENGRVMASGGELGEADLAAAMREAETIIASRNIDAAQQAAQMQYLAAMTRAGSSVLDTLPGDLFFPENTPMHTVREVNLPGGLKGEFELRYSAVSTSQHGWLDRAQREVITRVERTEQRAAEEWRMAPV